MSREQIDQVATALRLFHHDGEPIELRRKFPDPKPKTRGKVECAWFSDINEAAIAIVKMDATGKYAALWHGINPRDVPKSRCTMIWSAERGYGGKAEDIKERRHIFLDFDRRDDGDKATTFATEEELDACRNVRAAVIVELAALGWPEPMLVQSANGSHAFYRVADCPNTTESEVVVAQLYADFETLHGTPAVKIDQSVKDIARVAAIPWTHSRKFPGGPRLIVPESELWPL